MTLLSLILVLSVTLISCFSVFFAGNDGGDRGGVALFFTSPLSTAGPSHVDGPVLENGTLPERHPQQRQWEPIPDTVRGQMLFGEGLQELPNSDERVLLFRSPLPE
jgi:hypothetical protein